VPERLIGAVQAVRAHERAERHAHVGRFERLAEPVGQDRGPVVDPVADPEQQLGLPPDVSIPEPVAASRAGWRLGAHIGTSVCGVVAARADPVGPLEVGERWEPGAR
jgi:hypothetical protein